MTKKASDEDIVMEIYRQMYAVATPPVDLDKLVEQGITKQPDWFLNYTLDRATQDKIIDAVLKKHKVKKMWHQKFRNTVILGASPKYEDGGGE